MQTRARRGPARAGERPGHRSKWLKAPAHPRIRRRSRASGKDRAGRAEGPHPPSVLHGRSDPVRRSDADWTVLAEPPEGPPSGRADAQRDPLPHLPSPQVPQTQLLHTQTTPCASGGTRSSTSAGIDSSKHQQVDLPSTIAQSFAWPQSGHRPGVDRPGGTAREKSAHERTSAPAPRQEPSARTFAPAGDWRSREASRSSFAEAVMLDVVPVR